MNAKKVLLILSYILSLWLLETEYRYVAQASFEFSLVLYSLKLGLQAYVTIPGCLSFC